MNDAELKRLRQVIKGHQGLTLSRSELTEICR